jgi:Cu/Ag efflux protein CusF
MRLWRVIVLLNLALAVGMGLGYIRWAREVRRLEGEVARLRDEGTRASRKTWTARGIVRAVVPQVGAVFLTHEALPGLMESMTMAFQAESPKLLAGLAPGDEVRFTLRQDADRLVVVAIQKVKPS